MVNSGFLQSMKIRGTPARHQIRHRILKVQLSAQDVLPSARSISSWSRVRSATKITISNNKSYIISFLPSISWSRDETKISICNKINQHLKKLVWYWCWFLKFEYISRNKHHLRALVEPQDGQFQHFLCLWKSEEHLQHIKLISNTLYTRSTIVSNKHLLLQQEPLWPHAVKWTNK